MLFSISLSNKERVFWNILRGCAVFLMLWGHCIQYCALDSFSPLENPVFLVIYSFHMPLFAFISGYLFFISFEKRDLKTLLLHKTRSMLWPIFTVTILSNLFMLIPTMTLSPGQKLYVFNGGLLRYYDEMVWFLWTILACSVAVGIACKLSKNLIQRGIYLMLGCILVALFPNMDDNLFLYPFFLAGFFCAKHRDILLTALKKVKYVFLILFPILASFYRTEHLIYLSPVFPAGADAAAVLSLNLYRFSVGMAGIGFCLVLCESIFRLCLKRPSFPKVLEGLALLGENSLSVYCLSLPLLSGILAHIVRKCMEPFGSNILAKNMLLYEFFVTPLAALGYSCGLLFVVYILKKTKLHILIFGK